MQIGHAHAIRSVFEGGAESNFTIAQLGFDLLALVVEPAPLVLGLAQPGFALLGRRLTRDDALLIGGNGGHAALELVLAARQLALGAAGFLLRTLPLDEQLLA